MHPPGSRSHWLHRQCSGDLFYFRKPVTVRWLPTSTPQQRNHEPNKLMSTTHDLPHSSGKHILSHYSPAALRDSCTALFSPGVCILGPPGALTRVHHNGIRRRWYLNQFHLLSGWRFVILLAWTRLDRIGLDRMRAPRGAARASCPTCHSLYQHVEIFSFVTSRTNFLPWVLDNDGMNGGSRVGSEQRRIGCR